MPVRRLFAVALSLAVLAACGSTVQTQRGVGVQTGDEFSASTPAATAEEGVTTATMEGGAAASGAVASASGLAGSRAGGAARTVTTALAATGRGWDQKNVYIGVITQKDAQSAFASFGFEGVDPGDMEAEAHAVANDINRRGGVLGRQVKIAFRDQPTVATAQNPDGAGAAACTYFTEDRPVVAVFNPVTLMDYPTFRGCLARAKVPLFSASVKTIDDKAGRELAPSFHQSVAVSWDALAPVLVEQLKTAGWFGGWNVRTGQPGAGRAKVGVVVDGTDVGTRIGSMMQRVLAGAGYPDTEVFQYKQASDGQTATVFSFAGRGVTHVIVTDVELLAFQVAAQSQGYKPRFGVTSYNAPHTNLSGFAPSGANNGAMGVGWAPALDVSDANDPGDTGSGRRDCLSRMAAGGQRFEGKRLAAAIAFAMCDALLLTAQGAAAAGSLTGQAISDGIARIGPTFSAAIGFGTALSATKRFIPGAVRPLAWVPACTCFKYTSTISRKL